MNNYMKILFIVILFSSCSILDKEKYNISSLEKMHYLNQDILSKSYIGMTREQIIYILGVPIISDSFDNGYHYYLKYQENEELLQKDMLNLYFKDNKVYKFNIT